MSKYKTSIVLQIKGRDWEFILMPDKTFDKLHNEDGGSRSGITLPNQYECHFRRTDWSLKDIRHELGHALYHMCLTASSGLTPDQVEETMCQIIGEHVPEIVVWTDRVAEKFFGRE
jgi:hypothetical protein